jgi:hypothetical protein
MNRAGECGDDDDDDGDDDDVDDNDDLSRQPALPSMYASMLTIASTRPAWMYA